VELWDRIDSATASVSGARHFELPDPFPEFTFIERVRPLLSDDESDFDSTDRFARELRASRGGGFESTWRGPDGALLSPSWLTVRSAAADPASGHVVMAGHLNHPALGMAPAHDLGESDMRNMSVWPQQGHKGGLFLTPAIIYVGSTRSGALLPLDAAVNAYSVDLDPATGTVGALIQVSGAEGAIVVYGATGVRRVLTVINELSGSERIRFSRDGKWLLVSTWRHTTLIEVESGRWMRLNLGNAQWAGGGESALLTLDNEPDAITPRIFSLSKNALAESSTPLTFDAPQLPDFAHASAPAPSADGREVLVLAPVGMAPEVQQVHGTGARLVRVDLASGAGRVVLGTFLDAEEKLERDVQDGRWTTHAGPDALDVSPDLLSTLNAPITEHENLNLGWWAQETSQLLVAAVNRAAARTNDSEDFPELLPEILASLGVIAHDRGIHGTRADWLRRLKEETGGLVEHGELAGPVAASWRQFGAAVEALEAGQPDLIDPIAVGQA
jgi:hypothetical protein